MSGIYLLTSFTLAYFHLSQCNKMTCPNCRTLSCYVCRKTVSGYEHFQQVNLLSIDEHDED